MFVFVVEMRKVPAGQPSALTRWCTVIVLVAVLGTASANPTSVESGEQQNELHDSSIANTTTTTTCQIGHFLRSLPQGGNVCSPCSECPTGEVVRRRCTVRSDTVCKECLLGQGYIKWYFGTRRCFRCRLCVNRKVLQGCTRTTDRICGNCKPGFFLDELTEECMACSYCYPEVPGYGIVEPMCVHDSQPTDYTCLPSLPPRKLRTTTVTPRIPRQSLEGRMQQMDEKLRQLGRLVSDELHEVREQLNAIRTRVESRGDSL